MNIAQTVCLALTGDLKSMLAGNNACLVPGPSHGKDDRSLSVKNDPANAEGFVVNSFAEDDPTACRDYVREAAGLPAWEPTRKERPADPQFVYRDQNGEPYLRVTKVYRDGKKSFYQHSWNGTAWVKGAQQVRIPYRLPEVIAADTIYIVEGEKDADRLAGLGLVATSAPEGAGKWRDELNHWFTGKTVVILADNDEPGQKHADQVEGALRGNAASVRSVHFPMLPEKGDVSDWLDMGNAKAELLAYVELPQNIVEVEPARLTSFNALDLMGMEFAPVRYVVPGYVSEGCTILAGAPKLGKSWLVLQAAMAVARGTNCLGGTCEQGDVLYLALEDNPRRLKERLIMQNPLDRMLGLKMPACLQFETEWPQADRGGIAKIEEWLKAHSNAKLVIIDVLKMFRAARKGNKNAYDLDYEDIRPLTRLAGIYKVAIIIVHHTNKGAHTADPFDRVSGTGGISGAADATLTLERNEAGLIELYGRGRDIEEIETAVSFDKATCTWSVRGDAAEVSMSDTAAKIVRAMREADEPMGPTAIATDTGIKAVTVRQHLPRLAKEGKIEKEGRGLWVIAGKVTAPSNPPLLSLQTSQPESPDDESNESNESNEGVESLLHSPVSASNSYLAARDGEVPVGGDRHHVGMVGNDDHPSPRGPLSTVDSDDDFDPSTLTFLKRGAA
ncbi:AAA family ATPase [Mesorhizobium sp. A623]